MELCNKPTYCLGYFLTDPYVTRIGEKQQVKRKTTFRNSWRLHFRSHSHFDFKLWSCCGIGKHAVSGLSFGGWNGSFNRPYESFLRAVEGFSPCFCNFWELGISSRYSGQFVTGCEHGNPLRWPNSFMPHIGEYRFRCFRCCLVGAHRAFYDSSFYGRRNLDILPLVSLWKIETQGNFSKGSIKKWFDGAGISQVSTRELSILLWTVVRSQSIWTFSLFQNFGLGIVPWFFQLWHCDNKVTSRAKLLSSSCNRKRKSILNLQHDGPRYLGGLACTRLETSKTVTE